MKRPKLVNEWMTDMVITEIVSPTEDALFDYIMRLEYKLSCVSTENAWWNTDEYSLYKLDKPAV